MALKDLYNDPASFKYNSKNNKYDKDIRGGGYSGQPYIKRSSPATIDQLNSLTTEALSLDYPIRGGSYEELAAREDFARIDRFLLSYPQGKAFLDKQKGLMFSNPLMETGKSNGFSNTRAYSDGRNLMTQIAEGGTGFRHPNAGTTLFDLAYRENKYEYIVSHKAKELNRLVTLTNIKINKQSPGDLLFANSATELGINTVNNGELFFYTGGPGSLYGLGNTIIQRSTNSLGAPIDTSQAPLFIGPNSINDETLGKIIQTRPTLDLNYSNYLGLSKRFKITDAENEINGSNISNLSQQSSNTFIRADQAPQVQNYDTTPLFSSTMGYNAIRTKQQIKPGALAIQDFRNDVIDPSSVQRRRYESNNVNKTTRIGIGDPGARPADKRINPNDPFVNGQDRVNMTYVTPIVDKSLFDGEKRDLIKFGFETIQNDSVDGDVRATHFRAFLTGYSDNHSADWQSKRYTGRGENFYTYQGFDRQVSFTFQVAAQSKQEMRPLYNKLNYLLSTLTPDYNSAGFMRGNITKLTIGELFHRTPGILTSLNLTVDDNTPWEIAFKEGQAANLAAGVLENEDTTMVEAPHIISVSATFIPILTSLPQISPYNNPEQTRILLASDDNKAINFLRNG
jgi:hypothetical protein